MDVLMEALFEASPYILVGIICAIDAHIESRNDFKRYEQRRRAYSEWRLKQVRDGRM